MKAIGTASLFVIGFALLGCNEEASVDHMKANEPDAIIRNLPTKDREFLLQPLEAALDDLREIAEYDPSLETVEEAFSGPGRAGTYTLRKNGQDTAMMVLEIETTSSREKHARYFDDQGDVFLLESTIVRLDNTGEPVEKRAYRIYFEEEEVQLSAYGKVACGDHPLSKNWVMICPTAEELEFLLDTK